MVRARTSASAGLLLLACLAPLAGCSGEGARAQSSRETGLTAHRGTFRQRLILSGELEAERGESMNVPRTNAFQLTIRWLAPDGVPVKTGDPVVAFDNSQFSSDLEEKRLSAAQAGSDLATAQAGVKTGASERRFDVQKARSALEKAKVDAAVPKDLLSLREYQERQLALKRAETDLAKAEEVLHSESKVSDTDVEVKRISLDKSRREIHTAEEAIDALDIKAPRDGMVLLSAHPFEGRKFQVGDSVWPGMPVATLPDLSSMMVQANLSDVDDGRVRPGMQVVCTLDAYPDTTYRGRVVDVSPVARESRRSQLLHYFPVRIALDKVDTRRMRPGMSVRVEVLGDETKSALLVPRSALALSAGGPRVLLASGGSAPVRLGPCSADSCVVESGVAEGTRLRSRDGRSG
ncbi:MAG TPA: efflux RND transporter periplasmic adaptor subunit [Thermoanaerobaculia bacterium]